MQKKLNLHTFRVSKGQIDQNTLIELFSIDEDFTSNREQFREDTIDLGFENEADRCAKEIFEQYKGKEEKEIDTLNSMCAEAIFNTSNFTGVSSYYYDVQFEIIDTDFEYIIAIAFNTAS